MKHQLLLMRHAKSSWEYPHLSDKERPLNARGLKAAPQMGKRIAGHNIRWDALICSPAARAYETALHVKHAVGFSGELIKDERLYFQGVEGIREVIASLDEAWINVMLLGHNPDMHELYEELTHTRVEKYPTAACALFQSSMPWQSGEGFRELWSDWPKRR